MYILQTKLRGSAEDKVYYLALYLLIYKITRLWESPTSFNRQYFLLLSFLLLHVPEIFTDDSVIHGSFNAW